jgi:4-diphosphocytidyl-2-C-methyl-D-erythritol kinase
VLHGTPLSDEQLAAAAATIGSDCPLFLAGGVCLMRGRGERITHLTPQMRHRFANLRLLLFKPDFGVATPWAYAQLAAKPGAYLEAADAEARVAGWFAGRESVQSLLFNSFERVVFRKFRALPSMIAQLREQPGVEGVLLSGSGSACFALLTAGADSATLAAKIRESLGAHTFIEEARVG